MEGEGGQRRTRGVEVVDGRQNIRHLHGHPNRVVGREAGRSRHEVEDDVGLRKDSAGVVERAWPGDGDSVRVEMPEQLELDTEGQRVPLRVGSPSTAHDEPMPAAVGPLDLDPGHPRRQPAGES